MGISRLQVELTFLSLMPRESEKVATMRAVLDTFPAASMITVVVQDVAALSYSEARANVAATIDEVVQELNRPPYRQFVSAAFGRSDDAFLVRNALLLADLSDPASGSGSERLLDPLAPPDLVSLLAGARDRLIGGDADVRARDLGTLVRLLRVSTGETVDRRAAADVAREALAGPGYVLSADGRTGLAFVQPTFTVDDLLLIHSGVDAIDAGVDTALERAPSGVHAGITGLLVVSRDEIVTSERGLEASFLGALVLIVILLVFSFRMASVPLLAGVPLLVGLLWTAGIAGLVVARLNIMTLMYLVALLGLGIDYGIHLLTGFTQAREEGAAFLDAVGHSFRANGPPIALGAATTGLAFLALVVAESSVVTELGLVAAIGIAAELLAMFLLIPALLGARHSWRVRRGKEGEPLQTRQRFRFMHGLGEAVARRPGWFVLIPLVTALALLPQARHVSVETNLMEMEAAGLESVRLQDVMVEELGLAPDVLTLSVGNLDALHRLVPRLSALPSVGSVESVASLLPPPDEQRHRADRARQLGTVLAGLAADPAPVAEPDAARTTEEARRLLARLRQLAVAGGPDAQAAEEAAELLAAVTSRPQRAAAALTAIHAEFRRLVIVAAEAERIELADIPQRLRDTHVSPDGRRFLVQIIPTRNPWERSNREPFVSEVEEVAPSAAGLILAADQLTEIAERDGLVAGRAALAAIVLLLLSSFRNVKLAVMALLPLLLAMSTLVAVMGLAGIRFDFINIITIPLLIGIAVDDAVHFCHRYRREGAGQISRVVETTGRAVLLTTITTVIGFGSFIPSVMRGLRSTGIVVAIALLLAFAFSILMLPGLLVLVREKLGWSLSPWGSRG